MYISQIRLDDVRCFGDGFAIDLEKNGEPVLWTSILGNNATGKTTLLRSIAIGLCDEASAAGLLKESDQGYIRRGKSKATIKITLKDPENPRRETSITTSIERAGNRGQYSFERLRQHTAPCSSFPWGDLFACAYGTGRGVSGSGDIAGYSVINAVYNMFNYSEGLQNPELAFRRMEGTRRGHLRSALGKVLDLERGDRIRLTKSGFTVDGSWGRGMPLRDLADGYKSTFYWITDLWGWAVSYDRSIISSEDISGIVLVDELEQHLHPTWQRYVLMRLRTQFPKVQFIVTTHSPLIALGTADIDDARMVALKLGSGNRVTVLEEDAKEYRGMRVDQILTSIFELPIARSGDVGDQILRFQELLAKDELSPEERETFERLKDGVIKELPAVAEHAEDLQIHRRILDLLANLQDDSGVLGER